TSCARDEGGLGGPSRPPSISIFDKTISIFDKSAEVAAAQRMTQLPERFGLDLPDALTRHFEALADLFERVLALFADAESQPQELLLLWRQHRQRSLDLRREVLVQQRLVGRAG